MSYGLVTVWRHTKLKLRYGLDLHVFVNGEDWTSRCKEFDDTPGREYALFYRVTPDGRFHKDEDGNVAMLVWKEFEVRPFPTTEV